MRMQDKADKRQSTGAAAVENSSAVERRMPGGTAVGSFTVAYAAFTTLATLLWTNAAMEAGALDGVGTIITALIRVTEYNQRNYDKMNLDGIFGLRALQGCLQEVISYAPSYEVPKTTVDAITSLEALAEKVTMMAEPIMAANDPEYYRTMSVILSKPFRPRYRLRLTDHQLTWSDWDIKKRRFLTHSTMSEAISDNCLMEITSALGGEPCYISGLCTRAMTTRGMLGYALTHQVLYTVLVEQWGCGVMLDLALATAGYPHDADVWQAELCTNMLRDMKETLSNKSITDYTKDLFFEQVFICGTLGFVEFMDPQWLPLILEGQDQSGCFKEVSSARRVWLRKLQDEKLLEDGCLVHTTAVASGALAAYLEKSIQSMPRRPDSPQLDGTTASGFSLPQLALFCGFLLVVVTFCAQRRMTKRQRTQCIDSWCLIH